MYGSNTFFDTFSKEQRNLKPENIIMTSNELLFHKLFNKDLFIQKYLTIPVLITILFQKRILKIHFPLFNFSNHQMILPSNLSNLFLVIEEFGCTMSWAFACILALYIWTSAPTSDAAECKRPPDGSLCQFSINVFSPFSATFVRNGSLPPNNASCTAAALTKESKSSFGYCFSKLGGSGIWCKAIASQITAVLQVPSAASAWTLNFFSVSHDSIFSAKFQYCRRICQLVKSLVFYKIAVKTLLKKKSCHTLLQKQTSQKKRIRNPHSECGTLCLCFSAMTKCMLIDIDVDFYMQLLFGLHLKIITWKLFVCCCGMEQIVLWSTETKHVLNKQKEKDTWKLLVFWRIL